VWVSKEIAAEEDVTGVDNTVDSGYCGGLVLLDVWVLPGRVAFGFA